MVENTPGEAMPVDIVPAATPPQFDASALSIAEDAEAEIEIYNPRTKAGTGIYITVYGRDSEKARGIVRAQMNRRFRSGRRNNGITLSAEELEVESMDALVGCTKSWRGMFWPDAPGGPLVPRECVPVNVRRIYTTSPTIREQVDDAINDRTLFTQR